MPLHRTPPSPSPHQNISGAERCGGWEGCWPDLGCQVGVGWGGTWSHGVVLSTNS